MIGIGSGAKKGDRDIPSLKLIGRLSFARVNANRSFSEMKQCNKLSSGAHQRNGLLGVNEQDSLLCFISVSVHVNGLQRLN